MKLFQEYCADGIVPYFGKGAGTKYIVQWYGYTPNEDAV